jgi:hypothetical protein
MRSSISCGQPRQGRPDKGPRRAGAISGVSIRYPAPRGAHPLTGKRAGDLPLTDGRRLYQALRGGRFLLAASPGELLADATAGYHDRVEAITVARSSGTGSGDLLAGGVAG